MSDTPVKITEDKTSVPDKQPTEKVNVPVAPKGMKNVQIHAGNIGPLTIQMLGEINMQLGRIAKIMEIALKEIIPEKVKEALSEKPKEEKPNG